MYYYLEDLWVTREVLAKKLFTGNFLNDTEDLRKSQLTWHAKN